MRSRACSAGPTYLSSAGRIWSLEDRIDEGERNGHDSQDRVQRNIESSALKCVLDRYDVASFQAIIEVANPVVSRFAFFTFIAMSTIH